MIYVDSCILIYALEDDGARGAAARRALAGAETRLATSPLALTECLIGPLRSDDLVLRDRHLQLYDRFVTIPLDGDAFVRAAELRARFGLRTPDALHLAAAQIADCEALWTNDRRLAAASHGLAVDVIGAQDPPPA